MARRRTTLADLEMWLSRVGDLATAVGLSRHGRPAAVAPGPEADELEDLCGPWFSYREHLLIGGRVTWAQLRAWAEDWWHAPERRPLP